MGQGNSTALNYINQHTQVVNEILNSTNQTCSGNCVNSVNVNLDFNAAIEGDLIIGGNIDQVCNIDTSCTLDAQTNNCIATSLSTAVQQNAEAINDAIKAKNTDASNITYLLTQFTQSVVNVYSQSCFAQGYNNTTYNVSTTDTVGGSVIFNPDINQTSNISIDCALQSSSVSQLKADLSTTISQIASAHSASILTPAVIIAIFIMSTVILAIFVKKLKPGAIIGIILLFALIGLGLFFLFAWLFEIPPFQPPPTCLVPREGCDPGESECNDSNGNPIPCVYVPGGNSSLLLTTGTPQYIENPPADYLCNNKGSYPATDEISFGGCRTDETNAEWPTCKAKYPNTTSGAPLSSAGYPNGFGYDGVSQRCYCPGGTDQTEKQATEEDYCVCNPSYGVERRTVGGVQHIICQGPNESSSIYG